MAVQQRRHSQQHPGTSPESSYTWKGQVQGKNLHSSWSVYADPELKRKKRVATYKVFTVEGKVKHTLRSSCRWLKAKYMEVRYGWW
ncbi:unnamed protein product [Sphagnum troendelagicum]|uniref:Uncharacterized protein n=1 Tax=Sphagnum troendelagicum TaxID=128251 RepID=A0ABP0UWC4_9BRYO